MAGGGARELPGQGIEAASQQAVVGKPGVGALPGWGVKSRDCADTGPEGALGGAGA